MKLLGIYGDWYWGLAIAKSLGLDASGAKAFIGAREVLAGRECGPSTSAVVWAPLANEAEEGVVDARGRRSLFAFNNSGCLRNPGVRKRFLGLVEELAAKGCNMVIDALRYPSPVDGELFLSCFCHYCMEAMPRLHGTREKLARAIKARDSGLFAEALRELGEARAAAVEELAARARDIAKSYGVLLEAAVFPPSLARLVGQRLDKLARIYNRLHIMLYHRCRGPACHNAEHAAFQKLLTQLGLPVRETLEKLGIESPGGPEALEKEGIPPHVLLEELGEARRLAGTKATPLLWLDNKLPRVLQRLQGLTGAVILFAPD